MLDHATERPFRTAQVKSKRSWTITAFSELAPEDMIDRETLARAIGRSTRSVTRIVNRGELPPSITFSGGSVWKVGNIIAHLDKRAAEAARKAERELQRLNAHR